METRIKLNDLELRIYKMCESYYMEHGIGLGTTAILNILATHISDPLEITMYRLRKTIESIREKGYFTDQQNEKFGCTIPFIVYMVKAYRVKDE